MARVGRWHAGVVAAGLVLAACSGDDPPAAVRALGSPTTAGVSTPGTTSITGDTSPPDSVVLPTVPGGTQPTVPGRTSTTVPGSSAAANALEKLLSDRVPSGFRLTTFDVGDTGPSDLEKAIDDDGSDDAREVLTNAGFVAGFQHLWVNDDEDEMIQFLYEFRDNRGAKAYEAHALSEVKNDPPADGLKTFNPGVPGASAFTASEDENSGALVIFVKGPYLVQLVSVSSTGADVVSRVTPLAQDQFARL